MTRHAPRARVRLASLSLHLFFLAQASQSVFVPVNSDVGLQHFLEQRRKRDVLTPRCAGACAFTQSLQRGRSLRSCDLEKLDSLFSLPQAQQGNIALGRVTIALVCKLLRSFLLFGFGAGVSLVLSCDVPRKRQKSFTVRLGGGRYLETRKSSSLCWHFCRKFIQNRGLTASALQVARCRGYGGGAWRPSRARREPREGLS